MATLFDDFDPLAKGPGDVLDYDVTVGEAAGTAFDRGLEMNPTAYVGRQARYFAEDMAHLAGGGDWVTPEKAREEVKNRGLDLKIGEGGISRVELDSLQYLKQREINANAVAARRHSLAASAAGVGAGFAAGVIDPLNVASAFIPIVSEARYASWLARAGTSLAARAAVRVQAGAIEGAVGAALVEPIVYAGAQDEQTQYGVADSFVNVMFGGVLGGGLHVPAGAVYDFRVGRALTQLDVGLRAALTRAPDQTHLAGLQQATVALDAEGPVRAEEVMAATLPAPQREMLAAMAAPREAPTAEGLTFTAKPVKEGAAITPAGRRVPVLYVIADLDSLVTSHTKDLEENPAYPQELQPRDRARAQSEAQISNIASRLNPELLGEEPSAGGGAPIVDKAGIVESGNGRLIALQRVAEGNPAKWQEYQDFLKAQGYDTAGIAKPVLVRVRTGELADAERVAFTREANAPTVAGMSTSEQARADAKALPDDLLDLHQGGDFRNLGNNRFVSAAIGAIAPSQGERAGFFRPDGTLSDEGARRLERALLARAFGDDAALITSLTEASEESGIKAIGNALVDVSPLWARMRADAAADRIEPSVDSTKNLLDAIRTIQRARAGGHNLLDMVNQVDLLAGDMDPKTVTWVRMMFRNANLTGPLGRDRVAELLTFYATEARKQTAGPNLLGDAGATPEQILAAKRDQDRRRGKQLELIGGQPERGADLFEPAPPARSDVPGAGAGEAGPAVGRDSGGDGVVSEQAFKEVGERFKASQRDWTAEQVFEAAEKNTPELNRMGREVAESVDGVEWHEAPKKTRERFDAKIAEKGTKPGGITDVVRGTLSANSPEAADAAVRALAERATILDEDWRRYPGNYVDRKINVRFEDGQVGEIIIASKHMIAVKNEAHKLLERSRGMKDGERDRQRKIDLFEQEREFFGPAAVKDNGPWEKVYSARASEVGKGGVAPKVFEKPSSVKTAPDLAAETKASSPIGDQDAAPSLSTNARSSSPTSTNAAGVPSQLSQVTDIPGRMRPSEPESNDRWAQEDAAASAEADRQLAAAGKEPTPDDIAAEAAFAEAHLASMRTRGMLDANEEAIILAGNQEADRLEFEAAAYEAAGACDMEAA